MSAELVWKIGLLSVKPSDGAHTDVVAACNWSCTASQSGKSAVIDGSLQFAQAGDPFVKFENLKESDVLQWCWDNGVDKQMVESKAVTGLQNVLSPPVVNKPVPWKVVNPAE